MTDVMYQQGYKKGYHEGIIQGRQSFGTYFDGTSIIIPSYNQKSLLLECIDSIEAYTAPPYEIIVIDNGSEDGTTEALMNRGGSIRVTSNEHNLGFARAINIGLMMAKGNKIVLMNNDVLVTEGWLDQLQHCLASNPAVGAVGPVTNYISGEQQIEVPYQDISGMREFAVSYHGSDPSKWKSCDRLVGFCILFPRSTFEEVGYLDEGYEIGNFEDDDFIIRLRFQGKQMMIAGDTFVHHYGSVTMKGLGQQGFKVVNQRNEDFFTKKWGFGFELLSRLPATARFTPLRSIDFFPSNVWVKSWSNRLYWFASGVKHAVTDEVKEALSLEPIQATRLSVIELVAIPSGPHYDQGIHHSTISEGLEGKIIQTTDGHIYQVLNGHLREFTSLYACQQWGLASQIIVSEKPPLPLGLPILPPLRLQSDDL